jgi:hypothetical protein
MAQTDSYELGNDAGLAFRLRLNAVLAAVQSTNAGPIPPVQTRPGMLWCDTSGSAPVLMIRTLADDAWAELLDGGTY